MKNIKRKSLLLIGLLICVVMFSGCTFMPGLFSKRARTDGVVETKSFTDKNDEFTGLLIEGYMEDVTLEIKQGDYDVQIETDRAYFDELDIGVRGDNFRVYADDRLRMREPIHIIISAPKIESLNLRGGVDAHGVNKISGDRLEMDFNGAAEADLELDYNQVEADISGAGELELKGRADKFDIKCSGAAEIKGAGLKTKESIISISGAGKAEISCSDKLDANISGAGEILYIGDPDVTKSISGAGSIEKRDN